MGMMREPAVGFEPTTDGALRDLFHPNNDKVRAMKTIPRFACSAYYAFDLVVGEPPNRREPIANRGALWEAG